MIFNKGTISLPYLGVAIALVLALGNIRPLAAADGLDTVESLKQKADADLGIAVENLKLKYLIALEKFQKKLAADGDLDGALAVKNEIGRANGQQPSLFGQAGASAAEVVAGGKITLAAKEARLGNGTQLDSEKGLLKGWSRRGASAAWSLTAIQPGTYKVTLQYRSGNLGGGILSIKAGPHDGKFSIAGVGSWEESRRFEMGKISLSPADQLSIIALQGNSREMIYIESVTLEPTKSTGTPE